MTDEKKPPQGVATGAQMVLDINQDGLVHMTTTCWGRPSGMYARFTDKRLLGLEVPFALSELRLQIKLGRCLTLEESAAMKAEMRQSSGYSVELK